MISSDTTTIYHHLLQTAKEAVDLKRRVMQRYTRKVVAREIHLKQFQDTEKELSDVIASVIQDQVKSIIRGLVDNLPTSEKSFQEQSHSLINQASNPQQWRDEIINRALPIMAIKMAEASIAQMMTLGIDPTRKGMGGLVEKHLPGQHNQMSHGRMGGTVRDNDGNLTMVDGSPLPDHIPKNIPPAWSDVQVALDPKADLLVKGKDSKGRSQSVYSDEHWVKAAKIKFARTNELRAKQDKVKKELDKDMKSSDPVTKDSASCLRLIQHTGIRPGGEGNTLAEKQAYGATTLRGSHVVVNGNNVHLAFVGKKGVDLNIPVTDPVVSRDLKTRKATAGDNGKLYNNTSADKLSVYSHSRDGGGFKTKDFRTAKGTSTAVESMKRMSPPTNQKEYKKAVKQVAEAVAAQLGNTPAVALQSYIDPAVFAEWRVK